MLKTAGPGDHHHVAGAERDSAAVNNEGREVNTLIERENPLVPAIFVGRRRVGRIVPAGIIDPNLYLRAGYDVARGVKDLAFHRTKVEGVRLTAQIFKRKGTLSSACCRYHPAPRRLADRQGLEIARPVKVWLPDKALHTGPCTDKKPAFDGRPPEDSHRLAGLDAPHGVSEKVGSDENRRRPPTGS